MEEESEQPRELPTGSEENDPAMLFCPACDCRLRSSRCKLVCDGCGYFMSCADYY
jgi:hypothetical protein